MEENCSLFLRLSNPVIGQIRYRDSLCHGLERQRPTISCSQRASRGKERSDLESLTREFIKVRNEAAAHIFVADMAEDAREFIIVYNNETKEIRVYWNSGPGPGNTQRLWLQNHYPRAKDNDNYSRPYNVRKVERAEFQVSSESIDLPRTTTTSL